MLSGWNASLLITLPFLQKYLGLSLFEVSLLGTAVAGSSILSSLLVGKVTKGIGKKNTVLLAVVMYGLMWLSFLFFHSIYLLGITFALGGLASGLIDPIFSSMIAKSTEAKQRGAKLGDFQAVGDLGKVALVSAATYVIALFSLNIASLLFFCSVVFALFIVFLLRFSEGGENKISETDSFKPFSINHLRSLKYLSALSSGVLDTFSSTSLALFLPFLLIYKGIDIKSTGIFSAVFFFGYFFGRILLGRLADKHGKAKMLVLAEICMATLIVGLVYFNSTWLIVLDLALLGMFTRGTSPILKAMVADSLEERDFEKGYGFYAASTKTSNTLSRPIYGTVAGMAGIFGAFYLSAIVALLTIAPAIIYFNEMGDR